MYELPNYTKIEPLIFFYKDGFGIKCPTKIDMPLNKESKIQSHWKSFFFLGNKKNVLRVWKYETVWQIAEWQVSAICLRLVLNAVSWLLSISWLLPIISGLWLVLRVQLSCYCFRYIWKRNKNVKIWLMLRNIRFNRLPLIVCKRGVLACILSSVSYNL